MNQPVNPFINADKHTKIGDVLDFSGDGRAHGVLLGNDIPGIGFELFHAERDALIVRIDARVQPLRLRLQR